MIRPDTEQKIEPRPQVSMLPEPCMEAEHHAPLVSVIIPIYNGAAFLEATLNSVLQQTYRPIEIVVVDDGSTDKSAAIVRSYPEVRYLYQPNSGNATARNRGVAASHGELIAFLDQDDLWMPDKLQTQVDYLLAHPHVPYVLAHITISLETPGEWPRWMRPETFENDPVGYLPSTLMVRRTIFEQIGPFDPRYPHGSDSDWFFRARDAGVIGVTPPQTLVQRRIHADNLSHQTSAVTDEMMQIIRSSIRRRST